MWLSLKTVKNRELRMKKIVSSKRFLASFFVTVAVVLIFGIFGNNNFINSVVKTIFSPVLTATSRVSGEVQEFKDFIISMSVYKEENRILKNEIRELSRTDKDISELRAENERLSKLLNLKSTLKFKTKASLVVSYEPNLGYNSIVINKRASKGAAVFCSDGLVGRVCESGAGWSRVKTLLNPEIAVGVRALRSGALSVVEGDEELSKDKYCKMLFFDKNADIMVGDILEATGDAGIYPEGIIVGTVLEIQSDYMGEKYAVVEPAVDFSELYEVLVTTEAVE